MSCRVAESFWLMVLPLSASCKDRVFDCNTDIVSMPASIATLDYWTVLSSTHLIRAAKQLRDASHPQDKLMKEPYSTSQASFLSTTGMITMRL